MCYFTYVHIGDPPVIGEDGILYGFYETPDIVSVPVAPAGDKAESPPALFYSRKMVRDSVKLKPRFRSSATYIGPGTATSTGLTPRGVTP